VRARNGGKGAAVYTGWDAAGAEAEWLGFCDADGSVGAEEVFRIADGLRPAGAGPDLVAASRMATGARREGGGPTRAVLGRIFAAASRAVAGVELGDTQCGAKFIRADVYKVIRPQLRVTRFAFDVELLARARRAGARIVEEPVAWTHRPGGSLRVVRDGMKMLLDLGALAARMRREK
jgi:glycosyltransferase involved in cell wall biosynthesis